MKLKLDEYLPVTAAPLFASEVEAAWIAEAKQRRAEIERGKVTTVAWTKARKRIFAR